MLFCDLVKSTYIYIRNQYNVMDNTQLTSVKVDKDLFDNFKIECVKRKFSLNKLVNRAMDLYLNDESFRKQVTNITNLKIKD
jgi:hypothetical protein